MNTSTRIGIGWNPKSDTPPFDEHGCEGEMVRVRAVCMRGAPGNPLLVTGIGTAGGQNACVRACVCVVAEMVRVRAAYVCRVAEMFARACRVRVPCGRNVARACRVRVLCVCVTMR